MTHKQCPECSEALVCPGHGAVQRPLVASCPQKRGGLWVSVHDKAGVEAPGIPVEVDGRTATTDATGLAAFDPLDEGSYSVKLGTLPPAVAERFAPPAATSIDGVTVTKGKIALAELVLRRRPTLKVQVSPPVAAEVTITHGDGDEQRAKTKDGTVDFGTVEAGRYTIAVARVREGDRDGEQHVEHAEVDLDYDDAESVEVQIAGVVNPVIDIDGNRTALAVDGHRLTATLRADAPFQGRGQLRITAGAGHIRVLGDDGNALAQPYDFRGIDEDGVTVQLEATSASAIDGVTLEWELFGDGIECGDPATEDLTAVRATLVIDDRAGQPVPRNVARDNGRVLAKCESPERRARVTVSCEPAEYEGQLTIRDRKGTNLALYTAATDGNALPLPHVLQLPLEPGDGELYVEGIQPSAATRDDALDLAIDELADRADYVVLTVVEATLEVCGPRQDGAEPTPLAEADKRAPGQALAAQGWNHASPRARVRVRKAPADATCTLRLRHEDAVVAVFDAEHHADGVDAMALPHTITPNAFDQAHAETGDGLVLWAEGQNEAAAPKLLSLDVVDVVDDCDAIGFTVGMATVDIEVTRRDGNPLTADAVKVQLFQTFEDELVEEATVGADGKAQLLVPPAPYRIAIVPDAASAEAALRLLRMPAAAGTAAAPAPTPEPLSAAVQVELDTPTSQSYELAPAYTKIQLVAYQIETGKYIGQDDAKGDPAAVQRDMDARCALMKEAIATAHTLDEIDDDPTTLKIFMAPEFYFRGRKGGYPVEELSRIPEQMRQETDKADYDDWMFVFGTAIGSMEQSEASTRPGTNVQEDDVNERLVAFRYECMPGDPIASVKTDWSLHLKATGFFKSTNKGTVQIYDVQKRITSSGKVEVILWCQNVPKFPTTRKSMGFFGTPAPGFALSLERPGVPARLAVPNPEVTFCGGKLDLQCAEAPEIGWVIDQGKFRGHIFGVEALPTGGYRVQFDRLTNQLPKNGVDVTLTKPREVEIFNVAFVQQGGTARSMGSDGNGFRDVTIYKESISSIDFEGMDFFKPDFNEEHRHLATLDDDPLTRLLPTTGSTDMLGMDPADANDDEETTHGLGGGSVFTMHDIRFGLEVCLDHAKQRLVTYHEDVATAGERQVQVQLIPSCGMEIDHDSCIPGSLVFNVDRYWIKAATNGGTGTLEPEAAYQAPVPAGIKRSQYFPSDGILAVYLAQDKPPAATVP
ncbi:MAG: hypothetical protein H6712_10455 [Myxococcales bacterium]|nr:hypothetical protein [Myxococcales bacterium]